MFYLFIYRWRPPCQLYTFDVREEIGHVVENSNVKSILGVSPNVLWEKSDEEVWASIVFSYRLLSIIFLHCPPARQNGDFGRNFAYFPLTFWRWDPILCFSSHMFTDSAYFCQFSAYFLPKMVPHSHYKLKHGAPSAVFSAHVFTDSAYFLPMFAPRRRQINRTLILLSLHKHNIT